MDQGLTVTLVPVKSLSETLKDMRSNAEEANSQPLIQGVASHIRDAFEAARRAKQQSVEDRMVENVRARRGEYSPADLAKIRQSGGSEIYMMLTASKCASAAAWLQDTLLGSKDEKPWTISPTPIPEMRPDVMEMITQQAAAEATQMHMAQGGPLTPEQQREVALSVKERVVSELIEDARNMCERMELKMEDQLVEGGFQQALYEFSDDLTTFPSAFIKGPVVRKRSTLKWVQGAQGPFDMQVADEHRLEWERVDPMNMYPAAWASGIDDGPLIERHKLQRSDLLALIGVEGYKEEMIRAVLEEYGKGGLHEWLAIDWKRATAEGKNTAQVLTSQDTIDALQYWGSVQGQMLKDWGIGEDIEIDPQMEYNVEAWLIGEWVIKAMINPDPLARRPYYKASWEDLPGVYWGNSVADKIKDCQRMCNFAARALANNMGIASGPQAVFNTDRIPSGETLTEMYPWKIWQVTSDPMGSSAPAVDFFQPGSNAGELMATFEKFSTLADEYSGVPRYMTGDNSNMGGAGRTASGMSMLMTNAGKSMKRVIGTIDQRVITPLLERLYYYNMRYSDDADLKGDVKIVARGANSLLLKDAAQVRRNEFLNIALQSPVVQQVVGIRGIAELLRQTAKTLDMDTDKLVTPDAVIEAEQMAQVQQGMQMQAAQAQAAQGQTPQQGQMPKQGQQLMDGAPVTDNFAPARGA